MPPRFTLTFERGGITYELPSDDPFDPFDLYFANADERRIALKDLLTKEGQKLNYLYDFGDNWQHDIVLEKILPRKWGEKYPQLITGKRRCPPEDCGGIWGYVDLLEILDSPDHPEYEDYNEWIGEKIDAEEFDLERLRGRLVQNLED